MSYNVIYDGNCNLCVSLVKLLEILDQGKQFQYTPMQNQTVLAQFDITPQDCEMGMILINHNDLQQRWQGSEAAEEIGRLLPLGNPFIAAYRAIPGLKFFGDSVYSQVRDHRYTLFGKRSSTYKSAYPLGCSGEQCSVVAKEQ